MDPDAIPRSPDALVVGAGTAGTTVARRIARAGRKVLLCDRATERDIGRKICGNAVADEGLTAIQHLPEGPRGPEVAGHLESGSLVLPDGAGSVRIPVGGIVLNRVVYGQRLLREAVDEGAVFASRCTCVGWTDRERRAVGLRVAEDRTIEVTPRLVVDASGYASVLTRRGGPTHGFELSRADVGIAYREIAPLLEPVPDSTEARVVLSPRGARRGYAWIFPITERVANIGLGGPLESVGSGVKRAFEAYVASEKQLATGDPIDAGAGMLPMRRPIPSLVGDGFLSVGDAGCQTSPLHGGGIVPSILAGDAAARAAVDALSSNDCSAGKLWVYNVWYMRDIGARHAAHDMLRRVLFGLSDDDLSYLTVELARAGFMMGTIRDGRLRPPIGEVLRIVGRALRRPGLTTSLLRAARLTDRIRRVHAEYPDAPGRLDSWIGQAEFLSRALEKLVPSGSA